MRFRSGLAALITAAAVATVSCSSGVSGNPQPGLTPVDVASLKVGAYTPEPMAYQPDIVGYPDIRLIEARRMLNYLVHPFEIDSDITDIGNLKFMNDAESMIGPNYVPEKFRPAAEDNNLLAGVYMSAINSDLRHRKKLIISIMRFPTDAAAAKAADQFHQIANIDPGRHLIPIAGHPDARASSLDDIAALAFISHGPYAILVNTGVPQPNQSAIADIFGKTISQQIELLDKQQPTPLDDILDLPFDPDGIMRLALPKAPDYSDPFFSDNDFAAFQPSGELHFERNPGEISKAFEESGVDLIGRRGGIVYRARDLTAAFHLQSALVKTGKNDEVLNPPPGLPDARCIKLDSTDSLRNFDELCAVVYGRYVGVVVSISPLSSRVDTALYQRAAAQYAVLAKGA
ncbi:hypothetical protein ACLMAL_00225 [Nocardia sp. CWNU-33]|uniref:DUF7373 family lipoprotein n=1 Tax=Nocardia sp. CWNU-33 TaxID=3392117 RepID=UPI00398F37BB